MPPQVDIKTARFTLEGQEALIAGIRKLKIEAPKELEKMLFGASLSTRNEAINSIRINKSGGRTYKRRSVIHQASPPGGPPNTDTGDLVRNITVEKLENGYDVGSRMGASHGFFLEFKEPSRGGRKWLEPAFEKGIAKLKQLVAAFR